MTNYDSLSLCHFADIFFRNARESKRVKLPPKEGPKKYPVYPKLPQIGNISTKFEKQYKTAISSGFGDQLFSYFMKQYSLKCFSLEVLLEISMFITGF